MGDTLTDLDILIVDCQATCAHAAGGHLLEIGWVRTRARDWCGRQLPGIAARLLRLPAGAALPPRVSRVTGIYPDDLVSGATPETVWGQLLQQGLGWRGSSAAAAAFPTTIHFSRFEEPFLRHLHKLLNPGKPFPLGIICTHEIIRRLLPWLPRRGMRAAAGYFGYSTPEKRRCAPHVTATAAIWANCVMLLEKDHGVESLADLDRWLRTTDIPPRTDRKFPLAGSDRLLPEGPGIYRMRRANGDLLYIGKAARLRQRVSSYFHKRRRHPEHILEMLTQARDLTATETASALEAALLESDEIKSSDPPYNRSLKVGDRRLVFCARDFSRQAGLPDQAHPLGPLPKVQDAAALQEAAALVTIRAGGRLDPAVADKLSISGIFRGGRPNADVLSRGLDVFWESHCSAFARGRSPARALPGIGARLWRVRLKAAEQEGDKNRVEEHTQEAGDVQAQPDWTPETVSTALEGLICRKMHLLRRARWLCLLSESALSWDRQCAGGDCLQLVFSAGVVISRQTTPLKESLPAPPGWHLPFRKRQQSLDLAAYDRLRIVTTELRRLLASGRTPQISIGPGRIIGPARLTRGLSWI